MENIDLHGKLIKRLTPYLEEHDWEPIHIGMALDRFEQAQGSKSIESMDRYLDWAEQHDEP